MTLIWFGSSDNFSFILARPVLDLNRTYRTHKGHAPAYPLCAAADGGFVAAVETMLALGADVHVRNPANGKTPLELATQRGHMEIVEMLRGREKLV
jgi:ankyrin repeat protein